MPAGSRLILRIARPKLVRSRPYRWVVLGVSTGINALAWGVRSTFALFYVSLLDEFAWDRGSTALVLGTLVAMAGIGCLAFLRGPQDLLLLLIYIASGFGFGMRIAQLSAIPADVFAGRQLGAILGVVQAGGGLGGAIGPFLGGWLFDVTGSYRLAFAAACAAIAGSAIAAWFAARPRSTGCVPTAPQQP